MNCTGESLIDVQDLSRQEVCDVTGGKGNWDPSSPVPRGYEHLLVDWDKWLVFGPAFG